MSGLAPSHGDSLCPRLALFSLLVAYPPSSEFNDQSTGPRRATLAYGVGRRGYSALRVHWCGRWSRKLTPKLGLTGCPEGRSHGGLTVPPCVATYPLLPEGRILALYWVHRGVVGSHHVPSNFPPQSSGARSARAPGTRFRSQTVVARRRPSEVRRHSCSTLLDTLPPS